MPEKFGGGTVMTETLDKKTIEEQLGEPVYPIYSFNFRWIQDGIQDPRYPSWHEGLPEGRIYNSTGFGKMFKEDMAQETIDAYTEDWWASYLATDKNKEKIINPELLKCEGKFKEYETWYLTWFQHETYDVGQTDEEALTSFRKYTWRKMSELEREGKDFHGLMGADDEWRWHGAGEDGEQESRSAAPCRCKFCKEQGVLRIAH